MEFGWDDAKYRGNLRKHSIDFFAILDAFDDKSKVVVPDERYDYGEKRYNMLASLNGRIHNITFTERGELIWLISARKANKREQKRYANR